MAMDKGAAAAKPYGSDIDLRKLRVLVELDRRGTVSAVAAALHLTPSAVSQQLAGLAKELDVALTEPVGRRLRLTGAAKVVLRHAEEIFESIERLHRALAEHRGGEHGEVSVSGFGTTLAPLILPAAGILKRRLPGLRTTLAEVDPPVSFELLELGRTDVVIAVESPTAPVLDRRFDKRPLMTEVFDVALPAEHPLADAPSLALGDLAEEAWIFATVGMCQEIPLAACAAAASPREPRMSSATGTPPSPPFARGWASAWCPGWPAARPSPASRCGGSTRRPGAGCSPQCGRAARRRRRSRRCWTR